MGGGGGMPQAPAPRQAGPQMGGPPQQGGGPDPMQMAQFRQGQNTGGQNRIDELSAQIAQAQASGASPMVLADLQQQMKLANRSHEQWQQRQYGEEMGKLTQQGQPGIGGAPGAPSQMQQNPYLEMLLRNRLGMGGGGRGGGGW